MKINHVLLAGGSSELDKQLKSEIQRYGLELHSFPLSSQALHDAVRFPPLCIIVQVGDPTVREQILLECLDVIEHLHETPRILIGDETLLSRITCRSWVIASFSKPDVQAIVECLVAAVDTTHPELELPDHLRLPTLTAAGV
jgi:hypothetical protein